MSRTPEVSNAFYSQSFSMADHPCVRHHVLSVICPKRGIIAVRLLYTDADHLYEGCCLLFQSVNVCGKCADNRDHDCCGVDLGLQWSGCSCRYYRAALQRGLGQQLCLDVSSTPHGTTTLFQGDSLSGGAQYVVRMKVPGSGSTGGIYPSNTDQVIVNYLDN